MGGLCKPTVGVIIIYNQINGKVQISMANINI